MKTLTQEQIQTYRASTFNLLPGKQLKTRDEAVEYVNQRGFVFFWPIRNVLLPSLWTAVAGDRPVADAHDDPGHVTWGWKDALVGSHQWYYGKILRKRSTMVAMAVAPYFYALTENYGSPEEDHLTLYEQGRLTMEARQVYEAILDHGPLDTIALRKAARLSSQESEGRFNKALTDLQSDFKLVPVAVTQAGAWRYAFAYDIVARHYPEIVEAARFIGEVDARTTLAQHYFRAVGVAQPRQLTSMFGWYPRQTESTIQRLVETGFLQRDVQVEQQPGEWVALTELCQ